LAIALNSAVSGRWEVRMMSGAELSALSALAGSALGGITPLVSNYFIQRGQTQRELLSRELADRQTLYSEFIQFATKVYVNATTRQLDNMDDLIALYALVSRIRLFASTPVIEAAEEFALRVTKRYGEKDISFEDLRVATLAPHVDPLNVFSTRCREEIRIVLRTGVA
jgi:hypothetical protein